MAYIGNQPTSVAFLTDSFTGNGTTTAFTMSVAPANTASVLVSITGVLQDPSTYSVVGTTLTFSAAPPTGTGNISVRYLGIPASGVTTTAYRTVTEFTATNGQTTFTPPSYTVGFINVYRNGVLLGSADYTATNGTTVVLANATTSGDLVTIESFYVSAISNAIPNTAGAVNSSAIATGAVTQAKLASGVAGNGPAFSAYLGSNQSITSATFTKIQLNTKVFDTANCFDSTTNYRFTPTVAGYYQVNLSAYFSGSGITRGSVYIYKNGAQYKTGSFLSSVTLADTVSTVNDLIYLNGTTDYLEFYAYAAYSANCVIASPQTNTSASASLVRSA